MTKYLLFTLSAFFISKSVQGQSDIATHLKTTRTIAGPAEKASFKLRLADNYRYTNPHKQKDYALEALHLCESLNDPSCQISSWLLIACANEQQGEWTAAIPYLTKAEKMLSVQTPKLVRAKLFNCKARVAQHMGDFQSAVNWYLESFKINASLDNLPGIGQNLNNLVQLFLARKEGESAIRYAQKALAICQSLPNKAPYILALHNLGKAYLINNNSSKGLAFLFESLTKSRQHQNMYEVGLNLGEIGLVLLSNQHYDSAQAYLSKAINTFENVGIQYLACTYKTHLARLHHHKGNLVKAEQLLLENLTKAKAIEAHPQIANLTKMLSDVYRDMGKQQIALEHVNIHYELKDSAISNYYKNDGQYLNTPASSILQTQQKAQRSQQATMPSHPIKFKWPFGFLATIAALLFGALATFTYFLYIRKKEAHKALVLLNYNINEQKEEIRLQAERLREANLKISGINVNLERKVTERTAKVKEQNKKLIEYTLFNAHHIRGPLARILGLANLAGYEESLNEQKKIINLINKAAKELDITLDNVNKMLQEGVEERFSLPSNEQEASETGAREKIIVMPRINVDI